MEKNLKSKIKQSGLIQNFIAEKIGVNYAQLSMMLNGKAVMSDEVRRKINVIVDQALNIKV